MQLELKEETLVDFIATKSDIAQSETKLIEKISDIKYDLKQEIYDVGTRLTEKIYSIRQEVSDVKSELKQDISNVQTQQKKQFMWFVGILVTLFGIMISLLIYVISKI